MWVVANLDCIEVLFFIHLIATTQMEQATSTTGAKRASVPVKVGTIFSWATLFAIVMNLKKRLPEPWKDVIPVEKVVINVVRKVIYCHLCSARLTYRHCKRAGQERIEGIGSSIIIRSYISDMCESCSFGLCRAAFLFIHLNARLR